ncbi:Cell division control protein [Mycena sanguinolenta]|uniref:Cell division control protein n=1 Tax=Mycena sanguinolenta TaxID=230812 RepID=A0A8H6WYY5_9AGAR|nr:Cell division control protein [Mycena sanguinolenta]
MASLSLRVIKKAKSYGTRQVLPGHHTLHPCYLMADLYSELLFCSRPEGVEIGDVGTVADDGTFIVFFNICKRNDPANRPNWGLPKGYKEVPLKFPEDYIIRSAHFGPGSHVSNSKVRKGKWDLKVDVDSNTLSPVTAGGAVDISSSAERIAMLLLQEGASRTDILASEKFRKQAKKHGENWYAHVRKIGYPMDNCHLYLVTGVDKSTLWNVTATDKHTGTKEISLKLKAVQIASAEGSYRWEWENGGRFSDSGPRPASEVQNQTVFFRGFKISQSHSHLLKKKKMGISISDLKPKGKNFFQKIFSRSPGVTQNVYSRDTKQDANTGAGDNKDSDVLVSSFPTSYERYHPADAINTHMFASSPDVLVAVTHDDQWISVLEEEDEKFPDDTKLLGRILSKYSIQVESGCAYLKPLDTRSPTEQGGQLTDQLSLNQDLDRTVDTIQHGAGTPIPNPTRRPSLDFNSRVVLAGGTGGEGGYGSKRGGDSKQLVSDAKASDVPTLTMTTLKDAGFKSGQIEEIRRALEEYYHAATTGGRSRRT